MSMFACRTILIFGAVWIAVSLPVSLRAQQIASPAEATEVPAPPVSATPAVAPPVAVTAVPATPAPAGIVIEAAPALPVLAPVEGTIPALAPPNIAPATPYAALAAPYAAPAPSSAALAAPSAALAPTYVGQGFSPASTADAMSPAIAASTPAPVGRPTQATAPPPPPAPPPGATSAQEGAPPQPPAAPPPGAPRTTRAPQPPGPAIAAAPGLAPYVAKDVNIRVDATITESRGEQTLGKKVISVTLRDGDTGSVRSSALVPQPKFGGTPDEQGLTRAPLNMDATVFLREGGRVLARVTLEYNRGSVEIGNSGAQQRAAFDSGIRQSVSVMLENGKPLVVAQSADPEGDRRVTLELKATILK